MKSVDVVSRRVLLLGAGGLAVGQAPKPPESKPAASPDSSLPPEPPAPKPFPASTRRDVIEIPTGPFIRADAAPGDLARKRWKLMYEFDRPVGTDKNVPIQVDVAGIRFASSRYGAAWLTTFEQSRLGNPETRFGNGYTLITRDAGKTWTSRKTKGFPRDFFALDESRCWLLTSDGIFFSNEFGADWEKRKTPFDKLLRLHFLDENNGFAFGVGKNFWRTRDGAKSWTRVKEADDLPLKSPNTWIAAMSFISPTTGMLAGCSRPERGENTSYLDRLPPWMMPERALRKRELPGSLFVFETRDAGATWKPYVVSAFGSLRDMHLGPQTGVAILAFGDSVEWPTEVIRLNPGKGTNEPLFRRRRYDVTDCALLANGGFVLAAIEHAGQLRSSGIAGRLRIFWSNDGKQWVDMRVHYTAEGTQAFLSRVSDTEIWAATDQGQILRLSDIS